MSKSITKLSDFSFKNVYLAGIVDPLEMKPMKRSVFFYSSNVFCEKCFILAYHGQKCQKHSTQMSVFFQNAHLADIVDQLETKPRKRMVFVSFPRLVLFDKCSILAYHGQKCQKVLPNC